MGGYQATEMVSIMIPPLLLLLGASCCLGADNVLVMRHCVRSPYPTLRTGRGAPGYNWPDNYTARPFPTDWNVTHTAACTPRGIDLATRYGAALISKLASPVSVRTDNVTRNLQTADAVVAGMGAGAPVHVDGALFNPVSAKVCEDLSSEQYNEQIEAQIAKAASEGSPMNQQYKQYTAKLEELQKMVGSGAAAALDHIPLNVSGGYLVGGLYVASEGIIETLMLEAGAGMDVAWGALDGANRSKLYTEWLPLRVLYSYLNHGGSQIGARNGGAVLWRAFKQLADPSPGSEVLIGHDLTLDGIASLLNMSWSCGEFSEGSTPPMSGLLFSTELSTVRVQAVCSPFEGASAGELVLGTVSIAGKEIGSDGVTLDTLRELARPNTDFDCIEKAV